MQEKVCFYKNTCSEHFRIDIYIHKEVKGGCIMPNEVRIKLDKEKTLKFLSFFVDDAIRIANERKNKNLLGSSTNKKSKEA